MNSKKRVFLSLLIFLLVFMCGMVGFRVFGGKEWSLLDTLYMTVITLSTVGYEEPIDISTNPAARIFAVVFIVVCLGTIAFAISSITAFIVEGELKNILWRKKMDKEISRLNDHYIVCGVDETAQTIIQELILTRKKFVVIEPLQERIDKLLSSFSNLLFIQGDPAEDDVLLSARIEKAKGILLSLPTDEENLFVTLSARSLNPKIRIVTKGIDIKSHNKMMKAGADAVVSPTSIGGMRMVSEMIRPAVVSFLDMMLRERKKVIRFEEVTVGQGSSLAGKTVGESKIAKMSGVLLAAIKNAETGEYDFDISEGTEIRENDVLILIASREMVDEVEKIAS
jgi:voltage-gated potassium channel